MFQSYLRYLNYMHTVDQYVASKNPKSIYEVEKYTNEYFRKVLNDKSY